MHLKWLRFGQDLVKQKTHNQEVAGLNPDTNEVAINVSYLFVSYAVILQMEGWTLKTVYL